MMPTLGVAPDPEHPTVKVGADEIRVRRVTLIW